MKKILSLPMLRLGFVILSSLAAILQVIAFLTVLEPNSNYFGGSAWLPALAVLFSLLGAACGTLAAYRTNRAELAKEPFSATRLPSLLTALGFLALTLLFAVKTAKQPSNFTYLITLAALVSALYAALSAFSTVARRSRTTLALLGFAPVLTCILLNAYYYFDVTVEMNAPVKTTLQLGLLCAAVYFTGEIRFHLKRALPRLFLTLVAWTVAFGALSALAIPVAYLTGHIHRADYAVGALLTLALAVGAVLRAHALLHPHPLDEETDTDTPLQEETTGEDSL